MALLLISLARDIRDQKYLLHTVNVLFPSLFSEKDYLHHIMFSAVKALFIRGQLPLGDISPENQAYNKTRSAKALGALCHAPSVNMYFAQDGSVRLCCHNMDYSIGKYPEQSIEEIWNGDAACKIRQDMKEYKLHAGCTICKTMLDMGAYNEVSARHFDNIPVKPYPTMMEFLLSNTCNLECVMCQGDFSSLIRKNREKLPPLNSPYDSRFIDQLQPYLRNLTEVRFSGSGEAFAIDIYYELWETLIRVNPECKIVVQTNGTYLNARIKDLLRRGNFQVGVSLDSLEKERFETIRTNASMERVLSSIDYFSDYSKAKSADFLIAMCVMRNNWDEMPAYVEFCTNKGAIAKFHQVYSPEYLSLWTLSSEKLHDIHSRLSQYSFTLEGKLAKKNIAHFKHFLNVIKHQAKAAEHREKESLTNLPLSAYEIQMVEMLKKSSDYFNTEEIDTFRRKLDLILEKFDGDEQKKLLYQKAFKINGKDLISAMLKYPEEYLLSEANHFFEI